MSKADLYCYNIMLHFLIYRSWSPCTFDLSRIIDSMPFPLTCDILVDVVRVYLDIFTE